MIHPKCARPIQTHKKPNTFPPKAHPGPQKTHHLPLPPPESSPSSSPPPPPIQSPPLAIPAALLLPPPPEMQATAALFLVRPLPRPHYRWARPRAPRNPFPPLLPRLASLLLRDWRRAPPAGPSVGGSPVRAFSPLCAGACMGCGEASRWPRRGGWWRGARGAPWASPSAAARARAPAGTAGSATVRKGEGDARTLAMLSRCLSWFVLFCVVSGLQSDNACLAAAMNWSYWLCGDPIYWVTDFITCAMNTMEMLGSTGWACLVHA